MAVICAETDADIQACWPVLVQLRPHFHEQDAVAVVRKQLAVGYRQAFVRHSERVAGVAGYRIMNNLAKGRICYVDDLVTDASTRSHGVGSELMEWLCQFARGECCSCLELDSGVQRFDAHRFYLRHRMIISCHHFSLEL